ncbi:hypothetical protein [Microbacterium sp.]|nr:hypothetical protein [Microbacterium sp.]
MMEVRFAKELPRIQHWLEVAASIVVNARLLPTSHPYAIASPM